MADHRRVPREPTHEMIEASFRGELDYRMSESNDELTAQIWRAMFDAAPYAPSDADKLLRELLAALDQSADTSEHRDDVTAMLRYGEAEKAARAYLAGRS